MRYCEYTIISRVKDSTGKTIEIKKQRCASAVGLREVEFKHPDYRDLRQSAILCTSHYLECFGDWDKKKEKLFRNFKNERHRYYKDLQRAKKYAEYFNEIDFRKNNYRKVEKAQKIYNDHAKNLCCYDLCYTNLDSVKKVYPILVYRPSGRMSHKLEYCSKLHWEKMKMRVGLLIPKDPSMPKSVTLDAFTKGKIA